MPKPNPWVNSAIPTLVASAGLLLIVPPISYGNWFGIMLLAPAVLLGAIKNIKVLQMSQPVRVLIIILGVIVLINKGVLAPQAGSLACLIVGLGLTFKTSWGEKGYIVTAVGTVTLATMVAAQAWVFWRAKGNTFQVEDFSTLIATLNQITGGLTIADRETLWMGVSGSNAFTITPEVLGWPFLALWILATLGWTSLTNIKISFHRFAIVLFVFGLITTGAYLIRLNCVMSGYWSVQMLPLTTQHLIWLIPSGLLLGYWLHSCSVFVSLQRSFTIPFITPSLITILLLVVAWTAPYMSTMRPMKILIDDGHGGWEDTKVPFTTEKYGRFSTYNYSLFKQWLSLHHKVITTPADSDLPKDLNQFEVVILKTPARDYTLDEIKRLTGYVNDGGGLLLIGDHTNLFGHTARLNTIAKPYGLEFRIDAAYPWQTPEIPYRHEQKLNDGNATFLNGIPSFTILTAATILDRTIWGLPLVISTTLASEGADYSNKNYFGPLRLSPDDTVGPLALSVAVPYGDGKVIAWGDSTIWSSFSMFHPGYPEIILRLIGYLGSPSYHSLGQAFVVVAIIFLLGILLIMQRKMGYLNVLALLFVVLPISVLTALVVPWKNQWPDIRNMVPSTVRSVELDLSHSNFSMNIQPTEQAISEYNTYTTFYAWIGRTGILPIPVNTLVDLDPIRPLVFLNPVKLFTGTELAAIANFVRTGGRLLILDDTAQIGDSTAPQILNEFGIQYRLRSEPTPIYEISNGMEAWLQHGSAFAPLALAMRGQDHLLGPRHEPNGFIVTPRLTVEGAIPRAITADGNVIWATKDFGAGAVTIFTSSHSFNQLNFGDIWGGTEPGQFRQHLYDTEFNLLEEFWLNEIP